jgi:hypothetical protein
MGAHGLDDAANVAYALCPDRVLDAAADGVDAPSWSDLGEGVEIVPDRVADPLDHCAIEIAAMMGERQPKEQALGDGIVDRSPFTTEIGKDDQSVGSRRTGDRLVNQPLERGRLVAKTGNLAPEGIASVVR